MDDDLPPDLPRLRTDRAVPVAPVIARGGGRWCVSGGAGGVEGGVDVQDLVDAVDAEEVGEPG